MEFSVDGKDELLMRLVNYFVTEENYSPIVVNGVRDEIWLQNPEGPYKIIRINCNYIHNKEQLEYDLSKVKNVMRQVKKKTLSFTMNALNILLDLNEEVKLEEEKNISSISIKDVKDVNSKELKKIFPNIDEKLLLDEKGLELIFNVTNNINEKTEKENKVFENIFRPKKIVVTNVLVIINVVIFLIMVAIGGMDFTGSFLVKFGAMFTPLVKAGEIWRLVTSGFLHGGILHLFFNMYALYLIGTQVENFVGKWKFLLIYFLSMIAGSLMSAVIHPTTVSVGASGAIFGLLGAMLYFGYTYRVYLGNVMRSQIIPVILFNLLLGFMMPGIDNTAHIGGLIGGVLAAMALGVQRKENNIQKINGWVVLIIYYVFFLYLLFAR